jgi:hypothetical protein
MHPGISPALLKRVGVFAFLFGFASLAGCGDETDTRPAEWGYIYPAIIEPSCATASCHSDIVRRSGVNLGDIDTAYNQLHDRFFVIPNNSAQSEVISLMRAQGARRMPPDFALPETDIKLIAKWIDAGATTK